MSQRTLDAPPPHASLFTSAKFQIPLNASATATRAQ
jgi:hypothetical protein